MALSNRYSYISISRPRNIELNPDSINSQIQHSNTYNFPFWIPIE